MLVLTRKIDQGIVIGDDIVITVLEIRNDSVKLGIKAPSGVKIQRDEIVAAVAAANIEASTTGTEDEIKGMILGLPTPPPATQGA